jgi:hypothetical protein
MIADAPHWSTRFEENAGRVLLRHYPYAVIYRAYPDRIEILAVPHGRRRQILDEYPDLEAADIRECLRYVAAAALERELPLPQSA